MAQLTRTRLTVSADMSTPSVNAPGLHVARVRALRHPAPQAHAQHTLTNSPTYAVQCLTFTHAMNKITGFWDKNTVTCAGAMPYISPGFSGHYQDLGTAHLKMHDSACFTLVVGS